VHESAHVTHAETILAVLADIDHLHAYDTFTWAQRLSSSQRVGTESSVPGSRGRRIDLKVVAAIFSIAVAVLATRVPLDFDPTVPCGSRDHCPRAIAILVLPLPIWTASYSVSDANSHHCTLLLKEIPAFSIMAQRQVKAILSNTKPTIVNGAINERTMIRASWGVNAVRHVHRLAEGDAVGTNAPEGLDGATPTSLKALAGSALRAVVRATPSIRTRDCSGAKIASAVESTLVERILGTWCNACALVVAVAVP
jgi:hypothetical protein